jgi:predicted DNA-binding transcriptional regulator YafY
MGGKYNESFPLHESQETLIDDENEFRIRLRVKITYDFIMELLSQSQSMKVIAPEHLKDKLVEIHREAMNRLNKENGRKV